MRNVASAYPGYVEADPHDEGRAGPEEKNHSGLITVCQGQIGIGDIYTAGKKSCSYCCAGGNRSPTTRGELPPSYFYIRDRSQQDRSSELPKPKEQGQERSQPDSVLTTEQRIDAVVDGRDIKCAGDCSQYSRAKHTAAVGVEGDGQSKESQYPKGGGRDYFHQPNTRRKARGSGRLLTSLLMMRVASWSARASAVSSASSV